MKNNINSICDYDILIIGSGPGGMTAAIYAARSTTNIAIIEKGIPGGKITKTSKIENYPGFNSIKGYELSIKIFKQTKKLKIKYIYDCLINITKKNIFFKLELLSKKILFVKSVIIATGTIERKLEIPGELELENRGVSYCAVCDGILYKKKDIVVVGGGYSAIEEAIYLSNFVNKIYLIHRSNKFRADSNIVNKAKKNPKIFFIVNTILNEIKDIKKNIVTKIIIKNIKTKKINTLRVNAVFPYIGSIPISDFAKNLGVLNKKGYFIVNNKCETILKGLYAVGDVTNTTLRQITTAIGDGAKAAQFALKYINNFFKKN